MKAFEKSEFEISIFIDASRKSKEAVSKFNNRIAERIVKNKAGSLAFKETLLGDCFNSLKVPVFYSSSTDNDDTLAAYAYRDKAAILSADQDYYRYENADFTIYKEFIYQKGAVKLKRGERNAKRWISKRNIIDPPPVLFHSPDLADISSGLYRCGSGSLLLKWMENPHITARPLRRALYRRLGIQNPITEIIPVWNTQDSKVDFVETLVEPDHSMQYDHFLDHPHLAVSILFACQFRRPSDSNITDLMWESHLFCCTATVYNLAALATGGQRSLLGLLLPIAQQFRTSKLPEPFVYNRSCKVCNIAFGLTQTNLDWYKKKGLSLPRRCSRCR